MPADTPDTPEQRVLDASVVVPAHGGLPGWAGLLWCGAKRWHTGVASDGRTRLAVWVAVGGEKVRHQPGIEISAERLDPRDLLVVDGVRVTTPLRSTCFTMRYAESTRSAARALSMAAYHDLVSIAEMREYAGRHAGWTGIPQCREALELADENCWSPPEFDTLMVWCLDAGLPRPLCNRPIFDRAGRHIGTPDLFDAESGTVVEYDGSLHLHGAQRARDLSREDAFRRVGLEYLTVLSVHRGDPAALAARMRDVRARAAWKAPSARAWTLELPTWWTPTHTVELRRAIPSHLRGRALRYRAA